MGKFALLIGVSEYAGGLDALPSAVRDIEALKRVLQDPQIGGFDNVQVLPNPDRQEMADQMYSFFASGKKDDLLLLFFSGHGVVNEEWNFHLSSRSTRKAQDKLIPTTAIAASEIQSWMKSSRSRRLVIILDCCFAGAFAKGMTAKGEEKIDIRSQLGGEGRAILTAANSTQSAFEQEGLELSIYSHYLVEGLAKGAADLNGDGQISVEELHDYVLKKVKDAAPVMTPEFYNLARDAEPILIARSPKDDPNLKYRKKVGELFVEGQISITGRKLLNKMRSDLNLSSEIAEAIEAEVLQPWRERERKLQEYQETLQEEIQEAQKRGNSLSDRTLQDLQAYQHYLGLRDEDIAPIQAELMGSIAPVEPPTVSPPVAVIELASEKGIDYTPLRDLLAASNWKKADQETYRVMIQAVGKKEGDWFTSNELLNFPCTDLKTIDQLWVQYSKGHFGFSVQKQIYVECGAKLDGKYPGDEIWEEFGDRVGWREGGRWLNYSELNPSLSSHKGQFPSWGWFSVFPFLWSLGLLFSRTETCEL